MTSEFAGGVSILLVDDDPLIRKGICQRLRTEGFTVTMAADGIEAAQAARRNVYHVVILDLRMPYRNGAEVLKFLRTNANSASARVFLLAQPGDAELVEQAMRLGAEAVFEKAVMGPRDIVSEILTILETGAPPVPVSPTVGDDRNVPSAVDDIARRFRRGSPGNQRGARGAASIHDPIEVAQRLRAAVAQQPPEDAAPAEAQPQAAPAYDAVDSFVQQERLTEQPAPAHQPPPNAAAGLNPHGIPDRSAGPPRRQAPPGPPPAVGPGPAASAAAPPLARTEPAQQPTHSYDTVLNRFMGQSAGIAAELGLPTDLMCPVCAGQIALRVWPNAEMENGIHGFFYCPRCYGQ